mmetsp:Transcript_77652/g.251251  ORF Transcript_77652/g.251251 Transcript_77652/m.251251 type:complete len:323 (-) Transcript_77652:377-1345(-)
MDVAEDVDLHRRAAAHGLCEAGVSAAEVPVALRGPVGQDHSGHVLQERFRRLLQRGSVVLWQLKSRVRCPHGVGERHAAAGDDAPHPRASGLGQGQVRRQLDGTVLDAIAHALVPSRASAAQGRSQIGGCLQQDDVGREQPVELLGVRCPEVVERPVVVATGEEDPLELRIRRPVQTQQGPLQVLRRAPIRAQTGALQEQVAAMEEHLASRQHEVKVPAMRVADCNATHNSRGPTRKGPHLLLLALQVEKARVAAVPVLPRSQEEQVEQPGQPSPLQAAQVTKLQHAAGVDHALHPVELEVHCGGRQGLGNPRPSRGVRKRS